MADHKQYPAFVTAAVLIGMGALAMAGCGSSVSARSEAPAAGWRISRGDTGGNPEASTMLTASTSSSAGAATAELRLVCNPNLYFVYLDFGAPLEVGAGDAATVSYAIDGVPFRVATARHVVDHRFWIRDPALIGRIFAGQSMAVLFKPLGSSDRMRAAFSLTGLTPAVRAQGHGCFDPLFASGK